MVDRVGLRRDAFDRYPHEFSGGQRSASPSPVPWRCRRRLIVADEPTSALDVSVQAQILSLLRELQRDTGVSYLFITHNIGVVRYIADQVAVMQRRLIEELGSVEAMLGDRRPTTPARCWRRCRSCHAGAEAESGCAANCRFARLRNPEQVAAPRVTIRLPNLRRRDAAEAYRGGVMSAREDPTDQPIRSRGSCSGRRGGPVPACWRRWAAMSHSQRARRRSGRRWARSRSIAGSSIKRVAAGALPVQTRSAKARSRASATSVVERSEAAGDAGGITERSLTRSAGVAAAGAAKPRSTT